MSDPEFSAKVAFLSEPEAYTPQPPCVEKKETHMSWVFLTDRHAWKLKKPVRYDYLDFSTVEARRRNCDLEISLNRRLAPDVYLGTTPLVRDSVGRMRLGGEGQVIDWLVWMRRLPQDRMLDEAIAAQEVSRAEVENVGRLLARFYNHATRIPWSPGQYSTHLESASAQSASELRQPEYALPVELIESVHRGQREFLEQEAVQLHDRVRQGRLVDAHGDLRPEHICLETAPLIIDCLEFNAEFRVLDPVSELAFLSLECDRLGASWVGESILETYRRETKDAPSKPLVEFYKRQHALVRAKIAVWHLRDSGGRDAPKWIAKAKDYLLRARSLQ